MALFPTNATQIQAFAGALYGVQVGSATMTQVNSDITAAGGLSNALNAYYTASFGGLTTATVAANMVSNLGISAANKEAATAYVKGVLDGTAANARGAAIMNILNLYAGMSADATFGADATAWNTKVSTAAAYTGSSNVAIGTVVATSNVFTLTTGNDVADANSAFRGSLVDSFRFSDSNNTITAGVGTLGAGDIFIDSSTTDADVLNATLNGNSGAFTAQNIETMNFTAAAGTVVADLTNVIGSKNVNVAGTVAARVDGFNAASASRAEFGSTAYTNTLTLRPTTLAGTTAAATAETIGVTISGATYGTTAATRSAVVIDGNAGNGQLETLNITSSGTATNDFALSTANNATLGTVNVLGSAGAILRVTHADITGATVVASANTGDVFVQIDRNGNTTTPTNVANFSGVDKIQARDSSGTDDSLVLASLASGSTVEALSGFAATTLTVTGAAGRTSDTLTVIADHATASTSVALGNLDAQDVETVNLVSSGNSTALIASGNSATLLGDATTVTITGDTSLNLSINVDAPSTGSRTTVVSAAGVTGTATVTLNASGDTNTTNLYNITGTANADTLNGTAVAANTITGGDGNDTITGGSANDLIDAGNGADNITASAGIDSLTGGAGNDTLVIPVVAATTAATQGVTTYTGAATEASAGAALAVGDQWVFTVNGVSYSYTAASTTVDTEGAAAVAQLAGRILSDHGVAFTYTPGSDSFVFTGKADGTSFTSSVSSIDISVSTTTLVAKTATATATASVGDVVEVIWSDFASGDLINKAALTGMATGGYYEGALGSATATTEYGMMVITGASYADVDTVEAAINTQLTDASDDDMIVVFINSTLGYAQAFYDSDIDANGAATTNSIIQLTGITTLSGLAAAFSDTGASFV